MRHFPDRASLSFCYCSLVARVVLFTYCFGRMCGRFTLRSRDRIRLKGFCNSDLPFGARYNIAPSQNVMAVGNFGSGLEIADLTWGLIPSWSAEAKAFINARAETLEDKPSFSDSFRLRRCLIPADGFFEWERVGRSKRPFYFQLNDESQFAFAGIWDQSRNDEQAIKSCAIITTSANELIEPLHDRMPAILRPESYEVWLDPKTDPGVLKRMLAPFPSSKMKSYPVSSAVNYPENDSAALLMRVDAEIGTTPSLF